MGAADDNQRVHLRDPTPNLLKRPRARCGAYAYYMTDLPREVTCKLCLRVMESPRKKTPTRRK